MKWLQLTVCIFLLAAAQAKFCTRRVKQTVIIPAADPENNTEPKELGDKEGDIKLEYGADGTQGAAMMFKDGQWGTICDQKGFRPRGWASVFCRQLHGEGWQAVDVQHVRDMGKDDMVAKLKDLPLNFEKPNCFLHNAQVMTDCPKNKYDENNFCQRGHEQDCWVTCAPVEKPEEGPCLQDGLLRLVDKAGVVNKKEGRAEMFVDGMWGTICDSTGFQTNGWAAVFCKQLNGLVGHDRYKDVQEITHVSKKEGFETWAEDDHSALPLNLEVPNCFARNTSMMLDCGHNDQVGKETCDWFNKKTGEHVRKGHAWDVWIKC